MGYLWIPVKFLWLQYGCLKKKSPYSLMCLLALFEKTAIVILKGSKIYHRINLKRHSSV